MKLVKLKSQYSEPLTVQSGIRQGDSLANYIILVRKELVDCQGCKYQAIYLINQNIY